MYQMVPAWVLSAVDGDTTYSDNFGLTRIKDDELIYAFKKAGLFLFLFRFLMTAVLGLMRISIAAI